MAKKETNTKTVEPTGYAEIGSYMYRNANTGKVSVKMHTSVNKGLQLDDADEVLKIKKIRVETRVVEDKGLSDGVAYQKDVETVQITDPSQVSNNVAASAPLDSSVMPDGTVRPGMDKADYLKNFLDKMKDDMTLFWIIIGGLAVVLAGVVGYLIFG